MKYKIAYKGDGTKETGEKIIAKLERLGGTSFYGHKGCSTGYYAINIHGDITCRNTLDRTYTLISLESTQKLFRLL